MRVKKYTKELLAPIIPHCRSFAEVMRKLGIRQTGGNQSNIKRRVLEAELDTSHFKGEGWNKGGTVIQKKSWETVLIVYTTKNPPKCTLIQRALREMGRPYKCEECKNTGEWNGKALILQNDHRDGNRMDNRPENVRFLCPNCHSQTPNFSRRGPAKTRKPPKETLHFLLWEKSTVQIGKMFGVSDKAVEKWAKSYKIPKPPRGYWAKKKSKKHVDVAELANAAG